MRNILVDPKYNPSGKIITSATKLGPGVTMAKFLGAPGSRTQLKKLYNDSFDGPPDFQQIARNLVLHAQIYQSIYGIKQFEQHRLVVSEGIYEPNPKFEVLEVQEGSEASAKKTAAAFLGASFKEKKAGIDGRDQNSVIGWVVNKPNYVGERPSGILEKRRTGKAVVYQLIDKSGKTDPEKTFDLAVYWKDYIDYDKLTLDYDTYDPDGSLTAQIVIETPEVPETYEVSYNYRLETTYNGEIQTKNELLEILDSDNEEPSVLESLQFVARDISNVFDDLVDNDLDII